MSSMGLISAALSLLAITLPLTAGITCYRGIGVQLPGAIFNQTMASIGCNNADYCLRSFGVINGQPGSFASCVTRANFKVTCSKFPACTTTTTTGNQASNFQTCCCNNDLCNADAFTGQAADSTSSSTVSTTTTTGAPTMAPSAFVLASLFLVRVLL